jgi:hypothetical protein
MVENPNSCLGAQARYRAEMQDGISGQNAGSGCAAADANLLSQPDSQARARAQSEYR